MNKCKTNCKCDFRNKKILVIEKNSVAKMALAIKLSSYEFATLSTNNSVDGFTLAEEKQPDLILINIDELSIKELSTLKKLKTSSKTKDIPIIVITDENHKRLKEECLELGVADFYIKTLISLNGLAKKINELL